MDGIPRVFAKAYNKAPSIKIEWIKDTNDSEDGVDVEMLPDD